MKRYFVAIEGEIPILESDITEEDFDCAGIDLHDDFTPKDYQDAAEYAAFRIIAHTGLEVQDAQFLGSDER